MRRPEALALILLLAACDAASAPRDPQAQMKSALQGCRIPAQLAPAATAPAPADDDPDPPVAGYVLALSWSPEFCRFRSNDARHAGQCRDNRFGFIVHGLWPQGAGDDHPRRCARAAPVDTASLRQHFCMMPSVRLMQDQWAAHGSCAFDTPRAYLAATARLWRGLRMPDIESLPRDHVTAGDVRDAFIAANPSLPRGAIFIDRDSKGWLEEVRLCHDLSLRLARCINGRIGARDTTPVQVWRRR